MAGPACAPAGLRTDDAALGRAGTDPVCDCRGRHGAKHHHLTRKGRHRYCKLRKCRVKDCRTRHTAPPAGRVRVAEVLSRLLGSCLGWTASAASQTILSPNRQMSHVACTNHHATERGIAVGPLRFGRERVAASGAPRIGTGARRAGAAAPRRARQRATGTPCRTRLICAWGRGPRQCSTNRVFKLAPTALFLHVGTSVTVMSGSAPAHAPPPSLRQLQTCSAHTRWLPCKWPI